MKILRFCSELVIMIGVSSALFSAQSIAADDIQTQIAKDYTESLLGEDVAGRIFPDETETTVALLPSDCASSLSSIEIPEDTDSLSEGDNAEAVWANIAKVEACESMFITLPVSEGGTKALLFFSGIGDEKIPAGHVALSIGEKELASKEALGNLPILNADDSKLDVNRATVVISTEQTTIELDNLSDDLKAKMEDYQDENDKGKETGEITFEQGASFYGNLENPAEGKLKELIELALPGFKTDQGLGLTANFSGKIIKLLFIADPVFRGLEIPDSEKILSLSLTLPEFTPFPYNLINKPELLHMVTKSVELGFEKQDEELGLSISSDNEYSLFNKKFSASSEYEFTWDGGTGLEGGRKDRIEIPLDENPAAFVPGLQITHLVLDAGVGITSDVEEVEKKTKKKKKKKLSEKELAKKIAEEAKAELARRKAGLPKEKKKKKKKKKITPEMVKQRTTEFSGNVGVGLMLKVGGESLQSSLKVTFDIEKSGKAEVADVYILLGGADPYTQEEEKEDSTQVRLDKIFPDVPFVSEFILEEGVIGFSPKGKSDPDFYVSGGATWERTNLGGKFALMTIDKKAYLFTKQNSFSFAKLFPKDKKFDAIRNALTVLAVPETLLVFTSQTKSGVLKKDDIPEPIQDVFEGFISESAKGLKLYGDGLSLTAKIGFPDGGDNDLSKAFSQMGLGGFGADDPLLISGSIGGLQSGEMKVALGVTMPAIELPTHLPGGAVNPLAKTVRPGAMEFYIAVEGSATPTIELGLKGALGLDVPDLSKPKENISLDMEGRIFFKTDPSGKVAVQVAGHLEEWKNAFGIAGLTYKDPAFTIGIAAQAATSSVGLEIGVGGNTLFTSKDGQEAEFAADLYLGAGVTTVFPFITPTAFGINLAATEISPESLVIVSDVLMRGVLAGPMSQVIIDAAPDEPTKKNLRFLQTEIKKASLAELIKMDQVPLPMIILKKLEGEDMAQIYFATPGVEIPGREDSGLDEAGLFTNSALSVRFLGQEHKLGESKIAVSANGLELYGKIEPFKIGELKVGKKTNKPTIDIKATLEDIPHFKMKGFLELKPVLEDETDFEISKDAIRFVLHKKFADVFEFELDARTEGKDVATSKQFNIKAKLTNNIDDFIETEVLPAMGAPKPAIEQLSTFNPYVLKKAVFEGELVSFLQGKSMKLTANPEYFGESRKEPVVAMIKSFTWEDPLNIMGNAAFIKAFGDDFIAYLMENPKETLPMTLGPITLEKGYFGGKEIGTGKKAQKVFQIKAGIKLPASNPQADMSFGQEEMQMQFSDNILNGLIETDFAVAGKMKTGVPQSLTFVGTTKGDVNKWIRDQVTTALGDNPASRAVNDAIQSSDLVSITKSSFSGDFEKYFVKGQKADLKLEIRVLGKYLNDNNKKSRVKTLKKTIPIYAAPAPQNVAKTNKAIEPIVSEIANLLIADAGEEIIAALDSIVGEPISTLTAELNCPTGAFFDLLTSSCWSCPKDYVRGVTPIASKDACVQIKTSQSKAKYQGDANFPWSCPKDSFYDPRNEGECWQCTDGFSRALNLEPVDSKNACHKLDLGDVVKHSSTKRYNKATGIFGTDCPAGSGQFWHIGDGHCYGCPAHSVRTLEDINGARACMSVSTQSIKKAAPAKQIKKGKPNNISFLDLPTGKFYSCPKGYNRTLLPIAANNACEKIEMNISVGKSEPRGQIKNKGSNLCFGAKDKKVVAGANVEMQKCFDQDSRFQSWYIDNKGRIRPLQQISLDPGKQSLCLDVAGAKSANGTNVGIWKCNDNKAQNWFVDKQHRIVSRLNGKCLNFNTKKNLEIWDCKNEDNNQVWVFGEEKGLEKVKTVVKKATGPMALKNPDVRNLCLQTDGKILTMNTCNGEANQTWYQNQRGQITDKSKKRCVDYGKNSNGVKLILYTCRKKLNATDSQDWTLNETGRYVSALGRCINFDNGKTSGKNAVVTIQDCSIKNVNQRFVIVDPSKVVSKPTKAELKKAASKQRKSSTISIPQQICNRWKSDQCLHIEHGKLVAGLAQSGWHSAQWNITKAPGVKYEQICSRWKSEQCLHIEKGPITADKIKPGWHSAQWLIKDVPKTKYKQICNRWKSKQCLHIEKGTIAAGSIKPGWHSAQWVVGQGIIKKTTKSKASSKSKTVSWKQIDGSAQYIALGGKDEVWVISKDGSKLFYREKNKWHKVKVKAKPTKIAIAKNGDIWHLDKKGGIYRGGKKGWKHIKGLLSDIAIGADGSVWGIGIKRVDKSGNKIFKYDEKRGWKSTKGTAVQVAVTPKGDAWVVNAQGDMFSGNGKNWTKMPGKAKAVAVGPDGSVWHLSTAAVGKGGHAIYRWDAKKKGWLRMPGEATSLAIGVNGQPWATDKAHKIYRGNLK